MPTSDKIYNVTVIICCYNSAQRLTQTLEHLAAQIVPVDFYWEVMLVNNASTDNTATIANEVWSTLQQTNVFFSIIDEPQPGQMHARKTGAMHAKAACIIFCDDDNWLGEEYVYAAYTTMQKDANIGAAGGQNHAVTDADEYPDWWEPYKDKYATGVPAKQSGDVSHRGFILGAGMVTRRSLFLQVFDDRYPSLLNGRNGEKLSTGDDFEYSKRLLLWGYSLYYNGKMVLQHFIPKERLTIAYRTRLMQGIEEAGKVLKVYDDACFVVRKHRRKNKLKLMILAPLRIWLAEKGWTKRNLQEEKLKFFYLSPFGNETGAEQILIKKFLNHK